jgi:hypothetical protein
VAARRFRTRFRLCAASPSRTCSRTSSPATHDYRPSSRRGGAWLRQLISRLTPRLRHRQFGVLVTTSAIARQGYEEVREDRHFHRKRHVKRLAHPSA